MAVPGQVRMVWSIPEPDIGNLCIHISSNFPYSLPASALSTVGCPVLYPFLPPTPQCQGTPGCPTKYVAGDYSLPSQLASSRLRNVLGFAIKEMQIPCSKASDKLCGLEWTTKSYSVCFFNCKDADNYHPSFGGELSKRLLIKTLLSQIAKEEIVDF
jgi:hypothetical protein